MSVREPFFAHQGWYPASPEACRQAVHEYLSSHTGSVRGSVAGIVPHAGWVFSGRTAGLTFAALADTSPDLVFVFGGHMHPGQRCVCMPTGSFGTPVGNVSVNEAIAHELVSRFGCEEETPDRFQPDNTIELQMPFVHEVWPQAKVVAVQVPPDDTAEAVGRWAADRARDAKATAVAIGSTDLTHYGANYGFSPKGPGDEALRWSREENDRPFIDRLLKLDQKGAIDHALSNHSACCAGAAAAAITFAKQNGATAGHLIEHTTSHETEPRGTPSMWVGYASIVY
jgi:AmmeMemoRadiSam system protein B